MARKALPERCKDKNETNDEDVDQSHTLDIVPTTMSQLNVCMRKRDEIESARRLVSFASRVLEI